VLRDIRARVEARASAQAHAQAAAAAAPIDQDNKATSARLLH